MLINFKVEYQEQPLLFVNDTPSVSTSTPF